jgi:hypothetical protein
MAPKKVTKGAPKRGEKVNTTDPRPKIVVETVNSPELSVEEVPFDAVYFPPPAVTTEATTMAEDDDDEEEDVPVRFNPPQIRARSETGAARHFVQVAGFIGLESRVPNLFGGQPGSGTAVGQILGDNLGRFRSDLDEPAASNDPLAYGDPFSRYQNRTDGGFGHQEG